MSQGNAPWSREQASLKDLCKSSGSSSAGHQLGQICEIQGKARHKECYKTPTCSSEGRAALEAQPCAWLRVVKCWLIAYAHPGSSNGSW